MGSCCSSASMTMTRRWTGHALLSPDSKKSPTSTRARERVSSHFEIRMGTTSQLARCDDGSGEVLATLRHVIQLVGVAFYVIQPTNVGASSGRRNQKYQ